MFEKNVSLTSGSVARIIIRIIRQPVPQIVVRIFIFCGGIFCKQTGYCTKIIACQR